MARAAFELAAAVGAARGRAGRRRCARSARTAAGQGFPGDRLDPVAVCALDLGGARCGRHPAAGARVARRRRWRFRTMTGLRALVAAAPAGSVVARGPSWHRLRRPDDVRRSIPGSRGGPPPARCSPCRSASHLPQEAPPVQNEPLTTRSNRRRCHRPVGRHTDERRRDELGGSWHDDTRTTHSTSGSGPGGLGRTVGRSGRGRRPRRRPGSTPTLTSHWDGAICPTSRSARTAPPTSPGCTRAHPASRTRSSSAGSLAASGPASAR